MTRCTLIIPDAGPLNSLWVADRLDLLLALDMGLVVVDAVYDDVTSDLSYPKDRALKSFIDGNRPPFVIENTDIGHFERENRRSGKKSKTNALSLAIVDFMSSDDGLRKYVSVGEPLAILFEDAGICGFNKPPSLHLFSTVGMLRGLERVGVIASADDVIFDMTHPTKQDRRPSDKRVFFKLPDGADDPAAIGSVGRPPLW
jgi:hypothetical protein